MRKEAVPAYGLRTAKTFLLEGVRMKAAICARYGGPDVLQLREVPDPSFTRRQLRIKVLATAVTSSDCFVRSGKVNPSLWLPMRIVIGFRGPRHILGMAFAGVVDSVGKDVRGFARGDAVFGFDRFGFGAYAEMKSVSAHGVIAHKPTNATYEEAAAIPYGGLLALFFLKTARLKEGQSVLVYGASGAVGSSAVQLAASFGANVTGACSGANMEFVKSLGAETVLDYTRADDLPEHRSFDLIFDAVGKRKTSDLKRRSLSWLSSKGKYVSVDSGTPKLTVSDLVLLKDLFEKRKLKAVIDRTYTLERIADAHGYVDQGHKRGNVVVTVGT